LLPWPDFVALRFVGFLERLTAKLISPGIAKESMVLICIDFADYTRQKPLNPDAFQAAQA
jgi:hypothetical protein